MTSWKHDPALVTTPPNTTVPNGTTTQAAAGTQLTVTTSPIGSVTIRNGYWEHYGDGGAARLDFPTIDVQRFATRYDFGIIESPITAPTRCMEIRSDNGVGFGYRIELGLDGKLYIQDGTNFRRRTFATTITPGETSISINAALRAPLAGSPTTPAGQLRFYLYNSRLSNTPVETWSVDDFDFGGTTKFTGYRYGKVTTTGRVLMRTNLIQANDTSLDTPIAPAAPAAMPTSAGEDQTVEPGAWVYLTGTGGDGSATWTQVSGPAVTLIPVEE